MGESRYAEEQIIGVLKQAEAGMLSGDLCRSEEFSESTFVSVQKPPYIDSVGGRMAEDQY